MNDGCQSLAFFDEHRHDPTWWSRALHQRTQVSTLFEMALCRTGRKFCLIWTSSLLPALLKIVRALVWNMLSIAFPQHTHLVFYLAVAALLVPLTCTIG